MKNMLLAGSLCAAAVALLSSCSSENNSLTNINKDWNRTIRAAHVYPINPLTQDLQPGDIFLSDSSIEDVSAWDEDSGEYLPLDHLIVRLYPTNYVAFYSNSFGLGDAATVPPRFWLTNSADSNLWSAAPVAAFPGYTFSIQQGGALNVALPIQGVPVALGLMGAKSASGTVTISSAHTYGIDEVSLMKQVDDYLGVSNNAQNLLLLLPTPTNNADTDAQFLNVVTRVFTTSKVAVSVYNESSFGGGVSAGSVNSAVASFTNAAADYSNLVNAVNSIGNSSPANVGGSLKFTSLSSRSVSLDETFPRPVIIGYLAFSVPITYEQIYFNAYGTNYSSTKKHTRSFKSKNTERWHFYRVPYNPIKRTTQNNPQGLFETTNSVDAPAGGH